MTSDTNNPGEGVPSTPQDAQAGEAARDRTEPPAKADGAASGRGTDAAEATRAPATDEISRLKAEAATLKAEAADLKDRLLRSHAEMDNVRKRLEKEKADTAKFAITRFAQDVVVIGDNVQRAIDAVPAHAAENDPALKSFLEGVTLIEREFINVLERHGIKRVDPKGQPFNPHLHQAVMEMPVADVPSGTVTQVFQPGYMIDERVLRPAMVVVAKGGMKPQPPAGEAAPDPSVDPASGSGGPAA